MLSCTQIIGSVCSFQIYHCYGILCVLSGQHDSVSTVAIGKVCVVSWVSFHLHGTVLPPNTGGGSSGVCRTFMYA